MKTYLVCIVFTNGSVINQIVKTDDRPQLERDITSGFTELLNVMSDMFGKMDIAAYDIIQIGE